MFTIQDRPTMIAVKVRAGRLTDPPASANCISIVDPNVNPNVNPN